MTKFLQEFFVNPKECYEKKRLYYALNFIIVFINNHIKSHPSYTNILNSTEFFPIGEKINWTELKIILFYFGIKD
jgi:hypothetical protein